MEQLVSILIPAFNAERWIRDTIATALAQTWKAKEIIVVDDGSTDHTLQIARSFADQGVHVIVQTNRGAAAARNAALRAAHGSYIQFLDADDLLQPQKIEAQLREAEDGRRSRVLLTCRWGRFFVRPGHASYACDALWRDLSPVDWIVTKFTDNCFMFPAAWLVSRRLIEAAGPWNERLSVDDDGEYICRLVAVSQQVRFVPEATCYYRVGNTGSLSAQKSDPALHSAFASLHMCIEQLLRLEDSERTRCACLRLLQDNVSNFYPEQTELLERCRNLAHSLGGELLPPRERPHFRLFRSIFGWRTAKRLRQTLNKTKLRVRRTIDGWRGSGAQAH
jgi:glycosyltransferase involved in cell wall biosynthesis